MNKRVDILGVQIDALTIDQAVQRILALAGEKGASYVSKPYVEFMEAAFHDPALRELLNGSSLCLPDGVALQWAAYYQSYKRRGWWRVVQTGAQIVFLPGRLGSVLPERFAGVDTTWRLLEHCRDKGLRVFLIGSPAGSTINRAAEAIQQRLPGISIAGTVPGEVDGKRGMALYRGVNKGTVSLQPLIQAIRQSKADIILTGIGFPQQEALNAALAGRLDHGVLVGEGGSFDYDSFGGQRRRAPQAMRRVGLEWLWRLILQPSRWRRQLAVPRFIWHVYREGKRTDNRQP